MMKTAALKLLGLGICLIGLTSSLFARQAPSFGASLTWNTGNETPSLEALHGKSVVVVFFQDWCPTCNGWSGEFFRQVEKAYAGDPRVTLVAIKTDGGRVQDALDYLKSRTNTDRWLVAVDENAAYYLQCTGKNKLYTYIHIAPDGSAGETNEAGRYYDDKKTKRFVLADKKTRDALHSGASPIMAMKPPLAEGLRPAVRLAEQGLFLSALKEVGKLSSDSSLAADAGRFRERIAKHLGASVERHAAVIEDANDENRYFAYLSLKSIERNYGKSAPGQAASKVVSAHARAAWLAEEAEAESDYQSIMNRAARADDERAKARIAKALGSLAEKYPNTCYGKLAAVSPKK